MDTIMEIIYDCTEDYCERDEITMETKFMEDLNMPSLDLFSMITELEDEFNIKVSDRDLQEIITVGDAVRIISDLAGLSE